MKTHRVRWLIVALALIAGTAAAARPKWVFVTREVQDMYRVDAGTFYMKTIGCQEQIFGDRADLKLNIGSKGGMLIFRNGHVCVIQKFLREVEAADLPTAGTF